MPKKRKRGAGLHYRKKHFRRGNSFIKIQTKSMEQDLNNNFTSTEPNSNIDIGLFDVTEFEKEREELNEKRKKDHYFQQRQRIAIVFVYDHIFCEKEECDWKRYNLSNNIIGILFLRKNAHQMVLHVLREFLHCKIEK